VNVRDIMNINVTRILIGSTLSQAAEVSALSNAADLVVVDGSSTFIGVLSEGDLTFIGVLSEGDLMRAALPSLSDTLASGEQLSAGYGLLEEKASWRAWRSTPTSSGTRSRWRRPIRYTRRRR
jgi:hypothetical protein